MKKFLLAAAASAAAIVSAAPAYAVDYPVTLAPVNVPPATSRSAIQDVAAGTVDLFITFQLLSNFTVSSESSTSASPAVAFTSANLYRGIFTSSTVGAPTAADLVTGGTPIMNAGGNTQIGIAPIQLNADFYTVRVTGTAPTGGSTVVSTLRFVPGTAAVPEPATWGLMLVGFGMVGAGLRSRRKVSVTYA